MENKYLPVVIAHFDSVFEGPNGDYRSVLESLAGVTADQAAWKPAPDSNSIWQIVDHLTASKTWLIDILNDEQPPSPLWTQPTGGENAWRVSQARLKQEHAHLKEVLTKLTEDALLENPDPQIDQTLLEFLLSLAAHEAHHCGQIDYLRGLYQ